MKKNLRLLSGFLVGVYLLITLIGCGQKDPKVVTNSQNTDQQTKKIENFNPTGYPVVNTPITITIAARHDISKDQKKYEDMKLFKEISEKTKVNIKWIEIASSAWNEKKSLMFASGDIPDAFWGEGIEDIDILTNLGHIIPLNKLIDSYAPNIKKVFEKRPEIKATITAPDNNIYSLFRVREAYFPATRTTIGINKKWLDKLGLTVPKTTDELYATLKQFKEKDPNGNGKPDEIPLIFMHAMGSGSVRNESDLFPPFGVYDNTSNSNLTYHLMTRNNQVVFTPADDGYKDALKFLNQLYKEGLLDKEVYTATSETYYAKTRSKDDLVGVVIDWTIDSAVGVDREKDFVQLPPLKGPKGEQGWTVVSGSQIARNMFIITDKNKYPEATMRWVDEFYAPEMSLQSFYGPIGEMFNKDANGKLIPIEPPAGISYGSWKWGNTSADSGAYAALKEYESMMEPPVQQVKRYNAEKVVQPYLQKNPFPNIFFSTDDVNALKKIIPDINSYVEMMRAKFVVEGNIDAQWDNYISQLKKMKLDDAMTIYSKAYSNYLKNK